MKGIILKMSFLLLFLFLPLLVLLTLPKFLLLDRSLSKSGLYLTAQEVKEGLASISLRNVNIYDKTSKLVGFDSLKISIDPPGISIYGMCQGKGFQVIWSPWSKALKTQDFTCLSGFENFSADLTIKEGIYGRLNIKGLNLENMKVDQLYLDMRGRVFTARAKVMGFELVGDGQVIFNPSAPLKSKVNGQVSGGGMRLTLSGTLEKLQLMR